MDEIVVGVDGSESAAAALRWAVSEGRVREAPVTALIAWGLFNQRYPDRGQRFDPDYGEGEALEALAAYCAEALDLPAPPEELSLRAVCDHPGRAMVAASEDASLVVVGGRGLGGFVGLLVGSVSYQCLHHATCPIAVIRATGETHPRQEAPHRPVVVGVDGSPRSEVALRWALEEARRRAVPLRIVHAWQFPYPGGGPYGIVPIDPTPFEQAGIEVLDRIVGAIAEEAAEVDVVPVLSGSPAAQALLDEASGAGVVVVGALGTGGFKGLLLGSVSTQVVHHSERPVVVVPSER